MTMKLVDPVVTRRAGLLSHDMHRTVFYQNHDDDDDASNDNYDDDDKHCVFSKLENYHTFLWFLVLYIRVNKYHTYTIHTKQLTFSNQEISLQPHHATTYSLLVTKMV